MVKKIYDIIPPSDKKEYIRFQKAAISIKERPINVKKYFWRNFKGIPKTLIISLVLLTLLVVLGFLFFRKSRVDIWPKTEILTLESKIAVSLEQKESDASFSAGQGSIPARSFKDQKTGSQDFSATGTILKEVKAEGIIKVYNNYSTQEQSLLPQTRFVSSDGKLFRSTQREVIAGGKYEGGKFIPGETDIKVLAAEPGEEYNIGPSTFSIPGFAGTPKYTAFYGKSFSNMTGGFNKEVAKVTQEDLDRAREILAGKLKKESRESLESSLPQGFILFEGAVSYEITEENYLEEVGSQADSFNFQLKVKSTGLVFEKSNMEKFAKELISLNIGEGKNFQEESLEIKYSPEVIDLEAGKMILNLEVKAKTYPALNLEEFKKALLGKSPQEVKIYLEDQKEIIKAEVNLGPFWRRRIPEDMNKVDIRLNL